MGVCVLQVSGFGVSSGFGVWRFQVSGFEVWGQNAGLRAGGLPPRRQTSTKRIPEPAKSSIQFADRLKSSFDEQIIVNLKHCLVFS